MLKFKHFISATLTSISMAAFSQDLTVVRIGAPGANADLFTAVMANHLRDMGWDTKVIGFPDCKGAEDWIQKNPNVPVMYTIWSDDFVLPVLSPEHPRNCPGLAVDEHSLVTIISEGNHMLCSINNKPARDVLKHNNAKIGIWNHPVQMSVAQDLIDDLKMPNARLVGFARGADLMQALVASDIDYMIISSENLARRIDANCVITTAPIEKTNDQYTIKDPSVKLVSVEELVNSPTRIDTGLWPLYVAYNVDMDRLRLDVSQVLKTANEYVSTWSTTQPIGGVAGGDSPEEQWLKLKKFLLSFQNPK